MNMSSANLLRQIPDIWTYRLNEEQTSRKVRFVTSLMKRYLSETVGRKAMVQNFDDLLCRYYRSSLPKSKNIFSQFCELIAKALLFRECHPYLFRWNSPNMLWNNSVLAKLSAITNRDIFFLIQKNRDLLEAFKNGEFGYVAEGEEQYVSAA